MQTTRKALDSLAGSALLRVRRIFKPHRLPALPRRARPRDEDAHFGGRRAKRGGDGEDEGVWDEKQLN